jgi:RNA polymerase sigma factor (sigma-70 family)
MMDPEVLAQLVKTHSGALVLYARQWTSAPEDTVQEAFLKLIRQRRVPENSVAWLYQVVRNAAISAGRSEGRRRKHESRVARHDEWFMHLEEAALDPTAAVIAVQGLPPEQREVLVAHLWGGLTFEEIAVLAGCSASTAHRWYVAGLERLRERLGVSCPKEPTSRG